MPVESSVPVQATMNGAVAWTRGRAETADEGGAPSTVVATLSLGKPGKVLGGQYCGGSPFGWMA